jgi:hypothetical protein
MARPSRTRDHGPTQVSASPRSRGSPKTASPASCTQPGARAAHAGGADRPSRPGRHAGLRGRETDDDHFGARWQREDVTDAHRGRPAGPGPGTQSPGSGDDRLHAWEPAHRTLPTLRPTPQRIQRTIRRRCARFRIPGLITLRKGDTPARRSGAPARRRDCRLSGSLSLSRSTMAAGPG